DTVRSTDVLVLVIKDNGAFDMDRTPAVILDPCFLAQSTRRGGGGGGGCTAGAFAPMALLLAAPLLLLLKK
ncbi:MAG: Synerg-CTERM sorting domain-containing protein, partial [Synergistota bacterium]|nr:Synerg-CTERM sorting domain-containing protein [Synergistota bacterium]